MTQFLRAVWVGASAGSGLTVTPGQFPVIPDPRGRPELETGGTDQGPPAHCHPDAGPPQCCLHHTPRGQPLHPGASRQPAYITTFPCPVLPTRLALLQEPANRGAPKSAPCPAATVSNLGSKSRIPKERPHQGSGLNKLRYLILDRIHSGAIVSLVKECLLCTYYVLSTGGHGDE